MWSMQNPGGLSFVTIGELQGVDKSSKIKGRFVGILLKITREQKIGFPFNTYLVSDGTGTAEVVLGYRKLSQQLPMPQIGDSVQIVGKGYTKVLGGQKNSYKLLKISAMSMDTISPQQQFEYSIIAAKNQNKKKKQQVCNVTQAAKLEPLIRELSFDSINQKVALRSLILRFCFYVFQQNTDIQSYIFNPEMVRRNKQCQQSLAQFRASRQSLQRALASCMKEMTAMQIFKEKVQTGEPTFYVVRRDLFKGIEKNFQEKVIQMEPKGGVKVEQLTNYVNQKLSTTFGSSLMLLDWKFSQLVLRKLQQQNRIFKTADKLIFPNIRT